MRAVVLFATVFFEAFPGAFSQATCVLASFQWAYNSLHQSPCDVTSSLLGVCTGGSYSLKPLTPNTHYLGPTMADANPCQCSTVSYSMISACAACQNGTISSWGEWSTNCANLSISSFPEPIPSGVAVPGWAYDDVETTGMFDPSTAQLNENATESTAIPQPSTTSATSSATSLSQVSTSQVPSSSATSAAEADGERNANVIVGSLLGGLLAVMTIFATVLCVRLRRNSKVTSVEAPATTEAVPESPSVEEKDVPQLVIVPPALNYASLASPTNSSFTSRSDSDGSLAAQSRYQDRT